MTTKIQCGNCENSFLEGEKNGVKKDLKDSNAAAHSVDSDIFQSSDSSICALQDLTLTFIS